MNRGVIAVLVTFLLYLISWLTLQDGFLLAFPAGIGFIVDAIDRKNSGRNGTEA